MTFPIVLLKPGAWMKRVEIYEDGNYLPPGWEYPDGIHDKSCLGVSDLEGVLRVLKRQGYVEAEDIEWVL